MVGATAYGACIGPTTPSSSLPSILTYYGRTNNCIKCITNAPSGTVDNVTLWTQAPSSLSESSLASDQCKGLHRRLVESEVRGTLSRLAFISIAELMRPFRVLRLLSGFDVMPIQHSTLGRPLFTESDTWRRNVRQLWNPT